MPFLSTSAVAILDERLVAAVAAAASVKDADDSSDGDSM